MTDAWDLSPTDEGATAGPATPDVAGMTVPADGSENEFATVYAFVSDYIAPIYAERIDASASVAAWCAQWFRHPEAVARLEAAWQAWEALRVEEGTGRSVWFRDHGDPCMTRLLSKDGPFRECRPDRHRAKPPLDVAEVPPFLIAHPGSTVHPVTTAS